MILIVIFIVRRSKVLDALQWLLANNKYYRSIRINPDALARLPEDGDLSGLRSVTVNPTDEDTEAQEEDEDTYCSADDRARDHQTVSARLAVSPTSGGSTCGLVASKKFNTHQ